MHLTSREKLPNEVIYIHPNLSSHWQFSPNYIDIFYSQGAWQAEDPLFIDSLCATNLSSFQCYHVVNCFLDSSDPFLNQPSFLCTDFMSPSDFFLFSSLLLVAHYCLPMNFINLSLHPVLYQLLSDKIWNELSYYSTCWFFQMLTSNYIFTCFSSTFLMNFDPNKGTPTC